MAAAWRDTRERDDPLMLLSEDEDDGEEEEEEEARVWRSAEAYLQNGKDLFETLEERGVKRSEAALVELEVAANECAKRAAREQEGRQDEMQELLRKVTIDGGAHASARRGTIDEDLNALAELEAELEARRLERQVTKKALEQRIERNHAPLKAARSASADGWPRTHRLTPSDTPPPADHVIDLLDSSEDEDESLTARDKAARDRLRELVAHAEKRREESLVWRAKYPLAEAGDGKACDLDLMPPLTKEEQDLYNYAMEGGDDDDVLFERFNAPVYRSQMRCLLPGAWLNDELINQYLALIRQRSLELVESGASPSIKCYCHLTLFYSKLMEGGVYDYKRVKKWTNRGLRKCDLFEMDIVFFPRNIGDAHWALCVAYIQDRRVEYFDSMSGSGTDCINNVLRYLADEHVEKKGSPMDTSDWGAKSWGASVPQQNNCNDCGVFTSTFANFLSLGQPLNFTAKDMRYFRKRICVDLMSGAASFAHPDACSA